MNSNFSRPPPLHDTQIGFSNDAAHITQPPRAREPAAGDDIVVILASSLTRDDNKNNRASTTSRPPLHSGEISFVDRVSSTTPTTITTTIVTTTPTLEQRAEDTVRALDWMLRNMTSDTADGNDQENETQLKVSEMQVVRSKSIFFFLGQRASTSSSCLQNFGIRAIQIVVNSRFPCVRCRFKQRRDS